MQQLKLHPYTQQIFTGYTNKQQSNFDILKSSLNRLLTWNNRYHYEAGFISFIFLSLEVKLCPVFNIKLWTGTGGGDLELGYLYAKLPSWIREPARTRVKESKMGVQGRGGQAARRAPLPSHPSLFYSSARTIFFHSKTLQARDPTEIVQLELLVQMNRRSCACEKSPAATDWDDGCPSRERQGEGGVGG